MNLVLLARLELIVQELASLLIATVHLKAIKEQLLIVSTYGLHLLLLVLGISSLFDRLRGSFTTSSSQGSSRSTNGTVGNGGTSTKGHTLSDGRADSGKHTATAGLHRSRGRRLGGSGSSS